MQPESISSISQQNQDVQPNRYRVIKIQELPQVPKREIPVSKVPDQQILQFLASSKEKNQHPQSKNVFETYCFKDTSIPQTRAQSLRHNFFETFFTAYNTHGNVLLVPDDIWLMILIYFSKYVDKNSQKLRHQFVKHEGKRQLAIWEMANSVEHSIQLEKQWDYFFKQIIVEIEKNTQEGVVDNLKCDFSTTTELYELVSTAVIMGAFKNYFDYRRGIGCCGISNILFDGTLEDWNKVRDKLFSLRKYDVDGELEKYAKAVDVILEKWIQTYEGNVDVDWWNRIMTYRHPGSGAPWVEGWILHFFGLYQRSGFCQIPKTSIAVPIKLTNEWTKKEKDLQMITDWSSYSKLDDDTYKPDISVGIIQRKPLNQL